MGSFPRPVHIAAFGFCAILAQTIFVRELLALFSGSEFVLGFLLFSHMLWTGLGAILSGAYFSRRGESGGAGLRIAGALSGAILPLTVVAIRLARGAIAFPPGEMPSPAEALLLAFFSVAPFGLVYGSVYDLASRLVSGRYGGMGESLPRVYFFEAVGSLSGALLFSILLVRYCSQFESAALVAAAMISMSLHSLPGRKGLFITALFLAAAALSSGGVRAVDRATTARIFSGYDVEGTATSKYGELTAARSGEVVSYFSGGSRLFSVPEPERTEEAVHIPLFAHGNARRVLLAGGVAGGSVDEVLKHRGVVSLDCLELDGKLIDLVKRVGEVEIGESGGLPAGEGRAAVRIIRKDARSFINSGGGKYDLIIVSTPAPLNLQWNRFYTREFFAAAAERLEPGGMLAVSHAGSENYLSSDQVRVLRTVYESMASVFGEVSMLPGGTVHFLAGDSRVDASGVICRAAESGIDLKYTGREYLAHRFSEDRVDFLGRSVMSGDRPGLNTDMSPVLPLYEQVLEAGMKGSPAYGLMARAAALPPILAPAVIAAAFLLLMLFSSGKSAGRTAVFVMGFGSFLFQMMIMISLQAVSGHIYHEIVMVSALFMAGASMGASGRVMGRWGAGRPLASLHSACAVMLLLELAFLLPGGGSIIAGRWMLSFFYLFSLANGALTGAYYRSVARNFFGAYGGRIPAVYYAFDLFGACAGALTGGFILLPVSGALLTGAALLFIHASAALILPSRR
ncbi:MAG: hypothetical protein MUF59_05580 [Candidatus Krumholzibacteria bacterium]|nr:hypothetical protein [Candidatus Krumholzibacteria bacterium]